MGQTQSIKIKKKNMEKNKEKRRYGKQCEEQIKMWKNQYRKVVEVEVEDEDGIYHGYFHSPDMKTMKAAMEVSKTDEMEGSLILMKNCWLGGSDLLMNDGLLFVQTATQVQKMFASAVGRLKNL
jgi:hypothetical protein